MKGSSSAPTWTPAELAARCEALGARVEEVGNRYVVYPPDGGRIVRFNRTREQNGTHLPNVLKLLREGGLDVVAAWHDEQEQRRSARPTPDPLAKPALDPQIAAKIRAQLETTTTTTTKETAMAVPQDPRPTPTPLPTAPAILRQLAELRDMVRAAVDGAAELVAEQEERYSAQLADAAKRIAALEERLDNLTGGRVPIRPVSITELVRRAALAWFEAHPGVRTTPQLLEAMLGDQLPEGRGKTTLAGVCMDLAKAGEIQGGGANSRGIYWLEPKPAPAED